MAKPGLILTVAHVVSLFTLVYGTFIPEIFTLRSNPSTLIYSGLATLEARSKFECCFECAAENSCYAAVMNEALNLCLLLSLKNESHEMYQLSAQPDLVIWFKHGNHSYMELTTSLETTEPMMTATTTETSTEASEDAEALTTAVATTEESLTTAVNFFEEISCPTGFTSTSGGCFFISDEDAVWEEARINCQDLDINTELAFTDSVQKLDAIFQLAISAGVEQVWVGAADELEDDTVWLVRDQTVISDEAHEELWKDFPPDPQNDGYCVFAEGVFTQESDPTGRLSMGNCDEAFRYVCEAFDP